MIPRKKSIKLIISLQLFLQAKKYINMLHKVKLLLIKMFYLIVRKEDNM